MGDNRHTSDEHSAGKSTKPSRKGKYQKSVVFQTHYQKNADKIKTAKAIATKTMCEKTGRFS